MSFLDVKLMLDKHLSLISGSIPVAWENVKFTPPGNKPWLRPTLINGASNDVDLSGHQLNPGIYRVDAFYPLGVGEKDLLSKLVEIFSHFKNAQTLELNDTIISIQAVSLLPGVIDDPWMMRSLDINYVHYENSAEVV
jgi:hypothetical protein